MRPIEDISVDVFNGLGPSLDPDEQLAHSFIYGEADAKARGLSHYMTDEQRALVTAVATGPTPAAVDPNPGENLPTSGGLEGAEIEPVETPATAGPINQTIGLPLLEATVFAAGGPDLGDLIAKLVTPGVPEVVQPSVPSVPDATGPDNVVSPSVDPSPEPSPAAPVAPAKPVPRPAAGKVVSLPKVTPGTTRKTLT